MPVSHNLTGVDRWMLIRNLGYVYSEGIVGVVFRLRSQGYCNVADAVAYYAPNLPPLEREMQPDELSSRFSS